MIKGEREKSRDAAKLPLRPASCKRHGPFGLRQGWPPGRGKTDDGLPLCRQPGPKGDAPVVWRECRRIDGARFYFNLGNPKPFPLRGYSPSREKSPAFPAGLFPLRLAFAGSKRPHLKTVFQ